MVSNTASAKPINPNQHMEIPKWLNEEYFHPTLQKDVPDYSKVLSYTSIAATAPGENYASIMVRVLLEVEKKDGSTEHLSYILKTTLDAQNQGSAFVKAMNLFPKEKLMYQSVLPKFEQLYAEAGHPISFGPACLQLEDTPARIALVLEDLRRRKFQNFDRLKGLDMAHMTRVLHKLAELHAASARHYELHGRYDPLFDTSFYSEANRAMFAAVSQSKKRLLERAMREWGLENVDYYIAKVPTPDARFDAGLRLNIFDPDEFNVLNHGDCWVNNIMFNYKENGEIDETIFVDFQMVKWGTPAQDLWYMIVTSAALDIKVQEFDRFISIYHKRLVECLQLLRYTKPIPTLRELHIMMLNYGWWGVLAANGTLGVVLLPPDKDANMENMVKQDKAGEELRYRRFVNPLYAKAMLQLYPFFDNKGILEIVSKT